MNHPRATAGPFGVFSQIGHAPALYTLMGVLLPVTVAGMLLSTARNAFAAAGFNGASGVGNVAVAATIGGGLAGVLAGSLADRYSPRRLLIAVYVSMTAVALVLWWLVQQEAVSQGAFLTIAALDGALVAVSVSSMAKYQARLVPREAKGAAESVSGIRSSIGSLLGIFVGLRVGNGTSSILLAAVIFAFVVLLFILVTKEPPARLNAPPVQPGRARDFFHALRRQRELREIVIADALMYLALPSALLALGLVSEGITDLNPHLTSAGILGVLLGRLLVAARGTLGPVPRDLTLATVIYALLAIGSWYLLQEEWLLSQVLLMTAIATVASACGSFVQALLAAKLQERLPEDLRARGTGIIYGIRSLQLTIGVTFATWVISGWSLHEYLVIIGVGLLLVTIALRGFRRIV